MPLDQAVYGNSTSAGGPFIWAVRGGYVSKYNATTGQRITSVRYSTPCWGDATIAYDDVNDKIFCGYWNDKAKENLGDPNYGITTTRLLYKINPATLATEATLEVGQIIGFPQYIGTDQDLNGVHRIISYNGTIYCCADTPNNGKFVTVNPITMAVVTSGQGLAWNTGSWKDFCIQPAGAQPLTCWVPNDATTVIPLSSPSFNSLFSSFFEYDAADYLPYPVIYGVCWEPGSGRIFGTCRSQQVVYFTPSTVAGYALTSINTGDATAMPYRIAYNPYDGLLYVPGYRSNNIVVINPAGTPPTVSATKSGFDSPFDMVFTPTKKWAVQHGDVGLLEVV